MIQIAESFVLYPQFLFCLSRHDDFKGWWQVVCEDGTYSFRQAGPVIVGNDYGNEWNVFCHRKIEDNVYAERAIKKEAITSRPISMQESGPNGSGDAATRSSSVTAAFKFFSLSFGYVFIRFLLVPVRTRLLTEWLPKELYGSLNLAIMTITMLATGLSLGSFEYLVRHLPGRSSDQQASLFRLILVRMAAPLWGIVVAVCLLIGGWGLVPGLGWQDGLMLALGFLLTSVCLYQIFFFLGRTEMGRMRLTQMLQNDLWFLALLLIGAGVTLTFRISVMIWVGWMMLVVALTWRWLPWRDLRHTSDPGVNLRQILHFGVPLLPMISGEAAFRLADRYVLLGFRDMATLADYTLCANIAMIVFVVGASLLDMILPALYAHRNRAGGDAATYRPGPEARSLFAVMLRYSLGISLPAGVGLLIFNHDVLFLLSGPAFRSAAYLLPWLAATPLFFLLSTVFGRGLIAMDRTRLVGFSTLAAALLNVVFNLMLVPRLGGVGAALSNTVSLSLLTFYLGRALRWRQWTDMATLRGWNILGATASAAVWFSLVRFVFLPAHLPLARILLAGVGALFLLWIWGLARVSDMRWLQKRT